MTNYSSLSKDQLISQIYKLQSDFNVFSNQTTQVEELLQQQIEVFELELAEKNMQLKEMDSHLIHLQSSQSKIITLETENDLLESKVRMLQAQLRTSNDQQNQYIEKIAFLENEIDSHQHSLQNNNNKIEQEFENIQMKWSRSELEYKKTIESLEEQIHLLTNSKVSLEDQLSSSLHLIKEYEQSYPSQETQHKINIEIENMKVREKYLVNSLKQCQKDKQVLLSNSRRVNLKYKKLHKIATMLKLRQNCPVKAYTTAPLDYLI